MQGKNGKTKRIPRGEIWNWDEFSKMQGVPWEPVPGREGIEVKANIGKDEKPREVIPRPTKQIGPTDQKKIQDSVGGCGRGKIPRCPPDRLRWYR